MADLTFIKNATGYGSRVADNNPLPVYAVGANGSADTNPVQTYVSNSYANLTNSGLVKTGAGTLSRIVVGAAGTTITITVYDHTAASGTIIFGPYVLVAGANFQLDFAFGTGLYVSFSGTTGTPNITVGYR